MDENLDIIELIDEETGNKVEYAVVDGFEYKDRLFSVLLSVEENEDETMMAIFEELEENGEVILASLSEEEEDEIYDYYDQLCDEEFEDEDNSEEE